MSARSEYARRAGDRNEHREIHEGLNVVEQWDGANDFVFFAKRDELLSNRHEDHKTSMLCLHLLQYSMVYINTLMMQRIWASQNGRRG